MTRRRAFLAIGSVGVGGALIVLLIGLGKLDIRVTLRQLENVSLWSFFKLLALNCLLVFISTEKWRSIDAALRRSSDTAPSRNTAFALTSMGLALGVIVPVQFAMATARTFGTYLHGRALKRGAVGTLYEQGFDVVMAVFLGIASAVTWLCHGGRAMWAITALAATVLGLLITPVSVRLVQWLLAALATRNRIPRVLSELQNSGLLNARLARRLLALSAFRFAIVVLTAAQTAAAIGLGIPIWQFAAAVPLVIITSLIGVTPGGLGVNELTSVGALNCFGTPIAVGVQWAVANRVLVSASYFVIAGCAALALGARKVLTCDHGRVHADVFLQRPGAEDAGARS